MSRRHGCRRAIPILAALALVLGLAQSVAAQSSADRLRDAVARFERGETLETIELFGELRDDGALSTRERSKARKFLALGFLLRNEPDRAVVVFKDLVAEDPDFRLRDLALLDRDLEAERVGDGAVASSDSIGVPSGPYDYAMTFFFEATMQWRQEQLARQKVRLEQTSRSGALARSLVLPGLGQRYQGYRGRSWAMMGLTGATIAFAVVADRSFRDAQDAYDGAQEGEDFEGLWRDYADKADTADLALAVVGAAWALNLLDAALSGPNLAGLESVHLEPATRSGRMQLALRLEF